MVVTIPIYLNSTSDFPEIDEQLLNSLVVTVPKEIYDEHFKKYYKKQIYWSRGGEGINFVVRVNSSLRDIRFSVDAKVNESGLVTLKPKRLLLPHVNSEITELGLHLMLRYFGNAYVLYSGSLDGDGNSVLPIKFT